MKEVVALIRSNMPVFPALCYINAQRATITAAQLGVDMLYCEGSVVVGPVTLAHAWNLLDGSVVDFTFALCPSQFPDPKYSAQRTLDWQGVVNHRQHNKGWVGDPYKYGKILEVR